MSQYKTDYSDITTPLIIIKTNEQKYYLQLYQYEKICEIVLGHFCVPNIHHYQACYEYKTLFTSSHNLEQAINSAKISIKYYNSVYINNIKRYEIDDHIIKELHKLNYPIIIRSENEIKITNLNKESEKKLNNTDNTDNTDNTNINMMLQQEFYVFVENKLRPQLSLWNISDIPNGKNIDTIELGQIIYVNHIIDQNWCKISYGADDNNDLKIGCIRYKINNNSNFVDDKINGEEIYNPYFKKCKVVDFVKKNKYEINTYLFHQTYILIEQCKKQIIKYKKHTKHIVKQKNLINELQQKLTNSNNLLLEKNTKPFELQQKLDHNKIVIDNLQNEIESLKLKNITATITGISSGNDNKDKIINDQEEIIKQLLEQLEIKNNKSIFDKIFS